METIKYKVGDIVKRKSNENLRLISNIELGYYTLRDPDYPTCFYANDLSYSTVDNENVFEFVEHLNEVEFNERMNRRLWQL